MKAESIPHLYSDSFDVGGRSAPNFQSPYELPGSYDDAADLLNTNVFAASLKNGDAADTMNYSV